MQWLWVLVVFVLGWVAGDAAYGCWVKWKLRRWQERQAWDDHGVRRDCGPFTLGTGGEPAAVLCIHGFNDSPAAFRKMAPRLAAEKFFVQVMRLPGFAERLEQARLCTARHWQAAVTTELSNLRKRFRYVFVVGHSLGASLSVACLRHDPSLADACALLTPAFDVSRARSPLLHPETWHRLANRLLFFTQIVYSFFPNDALDPAERNDPCGTKFSWRAAHDEMFRLFRDNRNHAQQFRVPCFVALARHDHIVENSATQVFIEQCASPVKEVRYYDNSAHVMPLDYAWQDVTADVARFFQRFVSHQKE